MVPRLHRNTLYEWRTKHPEWNEELDEAWEVGCALDQMEIIDIADGIPTLKFGGTTRAQRMQYRMDVKRDRLRIYAREKRLQSLNHRYTTRQVIAGDADHPLIPSNFIIQPVAARRHDDEDKPARNDHEEE